MNTRKQITEAERASRRAAVNYARGSVRLEGLHVTEGAEEIYRRYVAGDIETDELVVEIGRLHGRELRQEAVKMVGLGETPQEPGQKEENRPLREKMEAFRRDNPMPEPTGQVADKAFFDELSGEPPD